MSNPAPAGFPIGDTKKSALLSKVKGGFGASVSQNQVTTQDHSIQSQALDVFENVLDDVEGQASVVDQVVPQIVDQATDTLNPVGVATPAAKEQYEAAASPDVQVDGSSSATGVEVEPSREMEMPVEVESYLEKVGNNIDSIPQEIVIADDGQSVHTKNYPKQPVVVLPITPEIEKEGEKKSTSFSIRWLVEWSKKLMKVFSGKVIYREVEN